MCRMWLEEEPDNMQGGRWWPSHRKEVRENGLDRYSICDNCGLRHPEGQHSDAERVEYAEASQNPTQWGREGYCWVVGAVYRLAQCGRQVPSIRDQGNGVIKYSRLKYQRLTINTGIAYWMAWLLTTFSLFYFSTLGLQLQLDFAKRKNW